MSVPSGRRPTTSVKVPPRSIQKSHRRVAYSMASELVHAFGHMSREVDRPELMATGAKRKDAQDRHLSRRTRTHDHTNGQAASLRHDRAPPHRHAGDRYAELFVKPGHQGEMPMARRIVPNINRLGGGLRRRGGHVVWIRNGTAGTRQNWSTFHECLMTPERMQRRYEEMEGRQKASNTGTRTTCGRKIRA